MKILVAVAHPDDEVLGMGGTIKKLSKEGNEVKIIFYSSFGLVGKWMCTRNCCYTQSSAYWNRECHNYCCGHINILGLNPFYLVF